MLKDEDSDDGDHVHKRPNGRKPILSDDEDKPQAGPNKPAAVFPIFNRPSKPTPKEAPPADQLTQSLTQEGFTPIFQPSLPLPQQSDSASADLIPSQGIFSQDFSNEVNQNSLEVVCGSSLFYSFLISSSKNLINSFGDRSAMIGINYVLLPSIQKTYLPQLLPKVKSNLLKQLLLPLPLIP